VCYPPAYCFKLLQQPPDGTTSYPDTGLADLNHGNKITDFNHDLNQVIFWLKKIM